MTDIAPMDYGEPASSPQGGQGQLGHLTGTPPNLGTGTATQELLTQPPRVTSGQRLPSLPALQA